MSYRKIFPSKKFLAQCPHNAQAGLGNSRTTPFEVYMTLCSLKTASAQDQQGFGQHLTGFEGSD